MWIRRAAALGTLLGAVGLGSCSLFSPTMAVPVILPELPPHWRGAFSEVEIRLQWPGGESSCAEDWFGAASRQVALDLPKRAYLPIVARPYLPREDLFLPCAGGVYPLDVDAGETLALSWAQGPLAQLLLELDDRGLDLERLNVPRLSAEMRLRGGEDPWNLDLTSVAAALASGQMRVTEIRLLPLSDVQVPAGPGQWFLESPLRAPCPADAQGLVWLQGVGRGFHRLFAAEGGSRLDLHVGELGVLWVRRYPE